MRQLVFLTLVAVGFVAVSPAAQTTRQGSHAVYGYGLSSCGTWTEELSNDLGHGLALSWVQGYLTGIGAGLAVVRPGVMRKTDMAGINQFITNYCAQNPTQPISRAAAALFTDLVK